jgi:hypothetical protein
VSELSDHHIDNIETKYRAGERVTAKILKVLMKNCWSYTSSGVLNFMHSLKKDIILQIIFRSYCGSIF